MNPQITQIRVRMSGAIRWYHREWVLVSSATITSSSTWVLGTEGSSDGPGSVVLSRVKQTRKIEEDKL